ERLIRSAESVRRRSDRKGSHHLRLSILDPDPAAVESGARYGLRRFAGASFAGQPQYQSNSLRRRFPAAEPGPDQGDHIYYVAWRQRAAGRVSPPVTWVRADPAVRKRRDLELQCAAAESHPAFRPGPVLRCSLHLEQGDDDGYIGHD